MAILKTAFLIDYIFFSIIITIPFINSEDMFLCAIMVLVYESNMRYTTLTSVTKVKLLESNYFNIGIISLKIMINTVSFIPIIDFYGYIE